VNGFIIVLVTQSVICHSLNLTRFVYMLGDVYSSISFAIRFCSPRWIWFVLFGVYCHYAYSLINWIHVVIPLRVDFMVVGYLGQVHVPNILCLLLFNKIFVVSL